VIFADVRMPGGGGVDLHRWMCASFGAMAPRFVFLTGGPSSEEGRYIEASGAELVLKPFDAALLRGLIAPEPAREADRERRATLRPKRAAG